MNTRSCLLFAAIGFAALAVGCQSAKSSRAKTRYYETPGSFTDTAARSAYVNQRVDELTGNGMSRPAAEARAAREWFARAPVASRQPTAYELERREAQADLESYLHDRETAKR